MTDTYLDPLTISTLHPCSPLASIEQVRSFELLRLAFFVLKLRKLTGSPLLSERDEQAYALCRNLLQHAVFQQLVSLQALGAANEALQLIAASPPGSSR